MHGVNEFTFKGTPGIIPAIPEFTETARRTTRPTGHPDYPENRAGIDGEDHFFEVTLSAPGHPPLISVVPASEIRALVRFRYYTNGDEGLVALGITTP